MTQFQTTADIMIHNSRSAQIRHICCRHRSRPLLTITFLHRRLNLAAKKYSDHESLFDGCQSARLPPGIFRKSFHAKTTSGSQISVGLTNLMNIFQAELLLCSTSRQWKHPCRPQQRCIYRATHHVMPWLEIGQRWLINQSHAGVVF